MQAKTLNNHQVKPIKDLIMAHPNAIIVSRERLKYAGDTKSKNGKLFYKFKHSCMGGTTTYLVSEDNKIFRPVSGKIIPLEHPAFKH